MAKQTKTARRPKRRSDLSKREVERLVLGGTIAQAASVMVPADTPDRPDDLTVIVIRNTGRGVRKVLDVTTPLDQGQSMVHPGMKDAPEVAAALRAVADWLNPGGSA